MNDTLVIMAKYPEPGRVKTRLAAAVGDEAACELYRAFLSDLGRRLRDGAWNLVWAMSPPASRLEASLTGGAARFLGQRGDGLGCRMYHCFADLFAMGSQRVVMLGADAPQLTSATVAAAFASLCETDVVTVPSRDGGYCLIGLRAAHDIFTDIEMGSRHVLEQTRRLCAARRLTMRELALEFDVDELDDARLLHSLIGDRDDLAATAFVLERWRREGVF